jgi:hypothetical protein
MNAANDSTDRNALAVYLRDHYAGSAAGLALVQRCREANRGTALGDVLAGIEAEIAEDRGSLEQIMARLRVTPSAFKAALGRGSELIGRLKSNGTILRRSPSSTVVELEGLAAGILTKASLWRSLRAAASHHSGLDVAELERLLDRAKDQLDRILAAHDRAAEHAFASADRSVTAGPGPGG